MTGTSGNESGLPGAARWVAVAVLGLAGLAGVIRAWIVAPAAMLDPRPSGQRAPAREFADDRTSAEAQEATIVADAPGSEARAPARAASVSRLINVNTASAAELDLLPGIGPALASRILEDRKANGPFATLDDLDRVSGIGPKTIAKLAPYAAAE